jgi:class 3 adenylate cyclase
MKFLLAFLFFCCTILAQAQSIQDLEAQLQSASSSKEKMSLNYQLAEEWLKKDARKSIEYAKAAHQLAQEQNNDGMAAEAAYLVSRGYDRSRDDRNEDVWLNSAVKFAMRAKDADLIIKTVDQRSRLAEKQHNERKALQIVQEAFDYFSKKTSGQSLSQMQAQYEVQKAQLERDKQQLIAEKQRLERDISGLASERDVLKQDKTALTERQQSLEQEKMAVEEEISKKEEEIQEVSASRAKALYIAEHRKRMIDSLETQKLMDSLTISQQEMAIQNAELEKEQGRYLVYLLGLVSIFVLLLALMMYLRFLAKKKSSQLLEKQNKIIEQERQRSDELLYNIMPVEVAQELKEKGSATAQQFPEATVLFTDFKNFTTIAERLTPEALVKELNNCFKAFDHIISHHSGIEKIKTIGDAYLCASGLVKHKTIPSEIVKAALEMQEFLDDHKQERMRQGLPYFEARIGIHTGPVVAGVVGFKKFAYDIWGDTVNIAARMEEQCEPGQVNISETTYSLVKYNFECQSRGRIPVKNKGMMEMYYVTGQRKTTNP